MGYRVEADGVSVAYVTDHEPYGLVEDGLRRGYVRGGDRRLIDFVRGVDLAHPGCSPTLTSTRC